MKKRQTVEPIAGIRWLLLMHRCMTHSEISERLGVTKRTLMNWLHGLHQVDLVHIAKLKVIFHEKLHELTNSTRAGDRILATLMIKERKTFDHDFKETARGNHLVTKQALQEYLAEHGESDWRDIRAWFLESKESKHWGMTAPSLRRAADRLGVRRRTVGRGAGQRSYWSLL
jgi:transcriptional regulator with XRE-family HTH domain